MPNFRCDYLVTADLALAPGAEELRHDEEGYEFRFRNDAVDSQGHAKGLVVVVIGPAPSFDEAKDMLRLALARQLDLLTFVTQSRFKIVQPVRLVEWERGQRQRQYKTFHKFDARYPPDPELTEAYLTTTSELARVNPPDFVRAALNHFRLGLLDELPEDQFVRLWTALEVIAENAKDGTRSPIPCPDCGTSLTCNRCGSAPTRVPFARQAIENLMNEIAGSEGPVISKRLLAARHGLVHGRGIESIQRECARSISDLVNELGEVVWHAIMSTIPLGADGPKLHFGHRDREYAYSSMLVSPRMLIEHSGEGPHPPDSSLPNVTLEMLTRFGVADGIGRK